MKHNTWIMCCLLAVFFILIPNKATSTKAYLLASEPTPTVATTAALTVDNRKLRAGDIATLSVLNADPKAFASSNKKIATVSQNGIVTGKKPGTATITCTTTQEEDLSIKITVFGDWAGGLNVAKNRSQLILVAAKGNKATLTFHQKSNGIWKQLYSTTAYIGRNGIGKTGEGDGKTPIGTYKFTKAFGRCKDPGTKLSYTKLNKYHYWVDDSNSKYYNRFVSTKKVKKDWKHAEHLISCGKSYNYVLSLNYNAKNVKNKGSAIFLHCSVGKTTSGCIAIPQATMKKIIKRVDKNCRIVIDTKTKLYTY